MSEVEWFGAVAVAVAVGWVGYMVRHPGQMAHVGESAAARAAVKSNTRAVEELSLGEFSRSGVKDIPEAPVLKVPASTTDALKGRVNLFYSYFDRAKGRIVDDLVAASKPVTRKAAEEIVVKDVVSAAEGATGPKVKFEVLTGKLKIDGSATISGVQFAAGDINLYKVATGVGIAIMACEEIAEGEFKRCLERSVAKAKRYIEEQVAEQYGEGRLKSSKGN